MLSFVTQILYHNYFSNVKFILLILSENNITFLEEYLWSLSTAIRINSVLHLTHGRPEDIFFWRGDVRISHISQLTDALLYCVLNFCLSTITAVCRLKVKHNFCCYNGLTNSKLSSPRIWI